jgi:hypothetical protein
MAGQLIDRTVGVAKRLTVSIILCLILFLVSAVAGGVYGARPGCVTCGSQMGMNIFMLGVSSILPTIWVGNLAWLTKLVVSMVSFGLGALAYFGIQWVGAMFISLGVYDIGLAVGISSGWVALSVSMACSIAISRKKSFAK